MTPNALDALAELGPEPAAPAAPAAPKKDAPDAAEAARRAHRPLPPGATSKKRGRPRKDASAAPPVASAPKRVAVAKPSTPADPDEKSPEEVAAEEARKSERRAFFKANAEPIRKALGSMYAMPFDFAATATGIDRLKIPAETKKERAETMFWCLECYCPDWTKHLPLVLLTVAVASDAGSALTIYREEKKKRAATVATSVPKSIVAVPVVQPTEPVALPPHVPDEPKKEPA